MKRFFVVGVGLSACCVLTPQANAGEWVASYEVVSGSSSGQYAWSVGPAQAPIFNQPYARNWVDGFWTIPRDGFKTAHPHFANSVSPTEYGVATSSSSYTVSKGGVGQAEIAGDVKVIWTWTASQGETTPGPVPPEIKFLVQSQTNSAASNAYQSNESPTRVTTGESGEADAGLPGAQQTFGIDSSASWWQSRGKRLYIQKTNGQSVIEGPTIHVTAKASIPADRKKIVPPSGPYPPPEIERTFYLFGAVSAAAAVTSQLDTREVKLTRGVGSKETFSLEDGIWVTTGDSIYANRTTFLEDVEEYNWPSNTTHKEREYTPNPNIVQFSPLFGGDWSHILYPYTNPPSIPPGQPAVPKLDGDWSPEDENDTIILHKQEMPTGTADYDSDKEIYVGTPTGPSQKIIVYEATDLLDIETGQPTSAKARARYVLNLHDPEEWESTPFRTDPPVWDEFSPVNLRSDANGIKSGYSVEADFQFENFYFNVVKDGITNSLVSLAALYSDGLSGALHALIAEAIGIAINEYAESPIHSEGAGFDYMWTYDWNSGSSNGVPGPGCQWPEGKPFDENNNLDTSSQTMERYLLVNPSWAVHYENRWYKGTSWDKNGKVGDLQQLVVARAADMGEHMTGDFVLKPTIPPAPPGPLMMEAPEDQFGTYDLPTETSPSGGIA